jgi:hypothetical protein
MALAAFCILTSLFVTATMVVTAYQNAKLAQEEDAMGRKPLPLTPVSRPAGVQVPNPFVEAQKKELASMVLCSGCGAKEIKDGRCLYCGGPR